MRFVKKRLSAADQGYSINALHLLGEDRIVAAPEGVGPAMAFTPAENGSAVLAEGPGGCMGFAPIPGRDDALVMITGFYPIFKAEKAGLHVYQAVDGLSKPWKGRRALDLPFVHRITSVSNGVDSFLVGATVCGGKDFQDDWSRPGTVYVAQFPEDLDGDWKTQAILEGVHRNHGMGTGSHNGAACVYVSGDEGIFALILPAPGKHEWRVEKIFDGPVSELYFADLDGDGEDELAVIEPFHGETMSVYKRVGGEWQKIYSTPLAFGHGLWAGDLSGSQAVIVGNRADGKNLVCYRVMHDVPFAMEELVIDEGSGTTNLDVVTTSTGVAIVTSNVEHAEYAMYQVEA
jgi:hypothetical protein